MALLRWGGPLRLGVRPRQRRGANDDGGAQSHGLGTQLLDLGGLRSHQFAAAQLHLGVVAHQRAVFDAQLIEIVRGKRSALHRWVPVVQASAVSCGSSRSIMSSARAPRRKVFIDTTPFRSPLRRTRFTYSGAQMIIILIWNVHCVVLPGMKSA